MATLTQASSTGIDSPAAISTTHRGNGVQQHGSDSKQTNGSAHRRTRSKDSKYRHVFATHSETRTACLSHESENTPSFVGFRNLMILVLSE
jgi:diacylglycerol O-acyltransferase-1